MSECKTDNSCETEESCTPAERHSDGGCTMAEDLLCLAKSAKHELLKEKMKKILEAKIGKKLDRIAEVAVDAALACMQQKIAGKEACDKYQENLMAALKG